MEMFTNEQKKYVEAYAEAIRAYEATRTKSGHPQDGIKKNLFRSNFEHYVKITPKKVRDSLGRNKLLEDYFSEIKE